jgi:hypothetical protein
LQVDTRSGHSQKCMLKDTLYQVLEAVSLATWNRRGSSSTSCSTALGFVS